MDITQHIAGGGGICGTCANPANATCENEGYSSCCNDRIEYGLEASETVKQANCKHTRTHTVRDTYNHCDDVRCVDCDLWIS